MHAVGNMDACCYNYMSCPKFMLEGRCFRKGNDRWLCMGQLPIVQKEKVGKVNSNNAFCSTGRCTVDNNSPEAFSFMP